MLGAGKATVAAANWEQDILVGLMGRDCIDGKNGTLPGWRGSLPSVAVSLVLLLYCFL